MTEPSKQIVTPKFRVAFPHLFEKETFKQGEPKFSITMLFPKDTDMSGLKAAARLAIEEKWGNKKPKGMKTPFKDGDAVDEDGELIHNYAGYENCWIVKASTKAECGPGIVDIKKAPIQDPEEVYGGCYGRAYIQAFAYDQGMSKGVSFALIHFQKLADGERFGNRVSAQKAFDDDISETSETDEVFGDTDNLNFGL